MLRQVNTQLTGRIRSTSDRVCRIAHSSLPPEHSGRRRRRTVKRNEKQCLGDSEGGFIGPLSPVGVRLLANMLFTWLVQPCYLVQRTHWGRRD